jgi:transcriptional regulator with XRE-family HTH domain
MERKCFGDAIHRARKARGMTLDVLSRKSGISKGYLSGIENGKVNPPLPSFVTRLAKQLALPEKELHLLSFVAKAPKTVRDCPEYVAFRDKVVAACRSTLAPAGQTAASAD